MSVKWLTDMIRRYIKKSGIKKPGSCHLFRHSCATSMLENGADVRTLQVLLGHENLNTTQQYTKISISRLKEVHGRTHPAKIRQSQSQLKEQVRLHQAMGKNDQEIAEAFNEKGLTNATTQPWTTLDIEKLK
jgi:hypothetical protein